MAGNTATPGASLVSRAFVVLGAFDDEHRRLRLGQVARRCGLPTPTVLRITRELTAAGALSRRADGTYVVGRRLWDLGLLAPVEAGLRELASPFLQDVHAATRATVHLAVREGIEVLYLDRVSGRASVPVVSRVGSRLPLHATGVGKVLLAHAPPDVVGEVMGHLTRVTAYTITTPGLLHEQLVQVRRQGFATTREEMSLGACSVAVPLTTGPSTTGPSTTGPSTTGPASARVVGSLGMVVPDLRRDRVRLVSALQVAAQGIARAIAHATARDT